MAICLGSALRTGESEGESVSLCVQASTMRTRASANAYTHPLTSTQVQQLTVAHASNTLHTQARPTDPTHLLAHAGEKCIAPPASEVAVGPLRACRRWATALFVHFFTHLLQGLEEERLYLGSLRNNVLQRRVWRRARHVLGGMPAQLARAPGGGGWTAVACARVREGARGYHGV